MFYTLGSLALDSALAAACPIAPSPSFVFRVWDTRVLLFVIGYVREKELFRGSSGKNLVLSSSALWSVAPAIEDLL